MAAPRYSWLIDQWDHLRSSLWFIPAGMALLSVGLALSAVRVDRLLSDEKIELIQEWSGDVPAARAVLSTIAGSMITVAGVVFSLTLVALQLASSQFGPRLLRTYMRDRVTQIAMGVFIGTFLYCLIVLRSVTGMDHDAPQPPAVSVLIAVLFAIISLGVLVYFIDHVAHRVHASFIIEAVVDELNEALQLLYPMSIGRGDEPEQIAASAPLPEPPDPDRTRTVQNDAAGYVRYVDGEALLALAQRDDLVIHLIPQPGTFVGPNDRLATVERRCDDEPLHDRSFERAQRAVRHAFAIGAERTALQDVAFVMNELVEMAMRAMSPSINDPFTAAACVDRVGVALARVAEAPVPSPERRDEAGVVRVISWPRMLPDLLAETLTPICAAAARNPRVMERLLYALQRIGRSAVRPEDLEAVRSQIELVVEHAEAGMAVESDRRVMRDVADEALKSLELPDEPDTPAEPEAEEETS